MSFRETLSRACIVTAIASLAGGAAHASDPLPGDLVAPPVNINIGLLYNEFGDAGSFGAIRGNDVTDHTHISNDITVGRYIRTFDVGGTEFGAQVYLPFVQFIGAQELGINNIPTPVAGLPAFGPGRAGLSRTSGFAQPNLGVFMFPLNNPVTGTYVVVAPWISPPISSFNKNSNLNPAQNIFTYELELGFRTTLIGTPKTPNLSVEFWGEGYGFADNTNSADVNPVVNADSVPGIYGLFGVHNPLQSASAVAATFREQPSAEFRVYLPYEFYPATGAFFAPGFYQSFGGKQTYRLNEAGTVDVAGSPTALKAGDTVDSGNRTDETQLRFVLSSFISPTAQVVLMGDYDIAAHGEPLNRVFEFRLAKFF